MKSSTIVLQTCRASILATHRLRRCRLTGQGSAQALAQKFLWLQRLFLMGEKLQRKRCEPGGFGVWDIASHKSMQLIQLVGTKTGGSVQRQTTRDVTQKRNWRAVTGQHTGLQKVHVAAFREEQCGLAACRGASYLPGKRVFF